jgi:hypothetical protein
MTLWVLLGLLALGGTFALILMTARRSARAESRGDDLAGLLLHEAQGIVPIDWTSSWQREHLTSRWFAAAWSQGVSVSELESSDTDTAGFAFLNKHYAIAVRPSPRLEADVPTEDGDLPIEAVAWPRAEVGPAKSVFFHPEDADRAYSRNLQSDYCFDLAAQRPRPGVFHRKPESKQRAWDYRAFDDERFLVPSRSRN